MTVQDQYVVPDAARARQRLALWTISAAQLLFLLDATIVNIALPKIQSGLGFSDTGLTWVVTGYSVAFGGLLLLGGRAGDLLGLRRTFMAGLTLFTLASLLAGLAPAPWWLLASRVLQGIGAAVASPAALSLIATTFAEGEVRNRALGVYTVIAGIGGPLGLVVGGLIATSLSWRWVMFVNVPVGLAVLYLAPRALREPPPHRGRFDVAGAVTGTLGVGALVYGLIRSATDSRGVSHWSDAIVLLTIGLALVLIAGFVVIEARSPEPLVPLRFLANRQRTGTLVVLMLESTAMFGVYFFMTLYLQRVWHYSPLRTALIYVPLSLILMGSARLGSRIVGRTGPRVLIVGGLVLAVAGLAWLSRIDSSGGLLTGLLGPTIVTYAGFGITTVPLTLIAMAKVAPGDSGLASGMFNTSRQVGGAIGLAVLGTVAFSAAGQGTASAALATGTGRGFVVAAAVTALALATAVATVAGTRR